jgi:8-oxo-dGTP pyrophosphatase MutT (NUDIX family)
MQDHLLAKIGQYGLILNEKDQILILQRARSKSWSLPGGRLSTDERDWKKALEREIKEEVGLDVIDARPVDINIIEDPYQVKYCVYCVLDVKELDNIKPSEEHSGYKFVGLEEIETMEMEYQSVKDAMLRYLKEIK